VPAGSDGQLEVGGRRIGLSNLDKILYPGGNYRKADVIDYYVRVSEISR
jgi:bifunctional non-homologous end joining protein LigD